MKIGSRIAMMIGTFFGAGYFPLVPGTFASVIGLLLFYSVRESPVLYCIITLLLIIAGFLAGTEAERALKQKDPKCVVIDEVAGMFVSLLFLPFYDFQVFLIAFLLFRIFDTLKAFPAGRIQYLKGSLGIMADDLIAGLYTNIIIQAVFRFVSVKCS